MITEDASFFPPLFKKHPISYPPLLMLRLLLLVLVVVVLLLLVLLLRLLLLRLLRLLVLPCNKSSRRPAHRSERRVEDG